MPPERYPYLNESASELLAAGYDPAEDFAFGLDVIIDGLERRRTVSRALARGDGGTGDDRGGDGSPTGA